MPDTTPNYGFRIPKADGSDLIVPDDIRLPVTSIDTQMKANVDVSTNLQAQINALKARVDLFDTTDPVQVSGVGSTMTASTGWSITSEVAYKFGRFAVITFQCIRTGANLASTADGNITNVGIATMKAGWPPLNRTGFTGGGVGGVGWWGYVDPGVGGILAIGATVPNNVIATNDGLYATMMYVWK